MARSKRQGDWTVVMSWEDGDQTLELAIAEGLSEVTAIDLMIQKERDYIGTGRSFTCLQKE